MEKMILNDKRSLSNKENASKLLELATSSLADDKAEDIKVIDLEGLADFAYFMVVASGRSAKHVSSTADKLADTLLKSGVDGVSLEGKSKGDWVLIDAHDIIVHIMRKEVRDDYQIEKIWQA